jgi:hypothetical protein
VWQYQAVWGSKTLSSWISFGVNLRVLGKQHFTSLNSSKQQDNARKMYVTELPPSSGYSNCVFTRKIKTNFSTVKPPKLTHSHLHSKAKISLAQHNNAFLSA